ncbi:hypothetical protein V8F20_011601 [Naviculisporaceae sp. PSN 640]
MSFGYGVGDFIAGANLAYKPIRVMAETRGASEEYQDAMTELCAIQQAFMHVGQIIQSKILPQATLNSASHIVMSSMDIIARFLERTHEYRKRFESNTERGNEISRSWCKVGWSLYKRDELRSLRDQLHCRLVAVNTLFAAAKHEHALPTSVSQYQDDENNDAASATSNADSGIDLMDSTFGTETNTTRRVRRLGRIEREKLEKEVQDRLQAARTEWEAKSIAAADEWRKEFQAQAKAAAMDEARAELEMEERFRERKKAEEEEKKRVEATLKAQLLEEAKRKAEELLKKQTKPPIKFKDAVGRKFSFPFHLAQTWQGMEELIKQAFLHVEVIGPHVQEGHYDLVDQNGEIILPSVWEKVVEPDWSITMHMWPMDKTPPLRGQATRVRLAPGQSPLDWPAPAGNVGPPPSPVGHGHGSRPGGRIPPPPGRGEGSYPPGYEQNGPGRGNHRSPHGHGSRPGGSGNVEKSSAPSVLGWLNKPPKPRSVHDSDSESVVSAGTGSDVENNSQDGKRGLNLGRLVPEKFTKMKLWKRSKSKKEKADDYDSDSSAV